jgi:hypothetical protein
MIRATEVRRGGVQGISRRRGVRVAIERLRRDERVVITDPGAIEGEGVLPVPAAQATSANGKLTLFYSHSPDAQRWYDEETALIANQYEGPDFRCWREDDAGQPRIFTREWTRSSDDPTTPELETDASREYTGTWTRHWVLNWVQQAVQGAVLADIFAGDGFATDAWRTRLDRAIAAKLMAAHQEACGSPALGPYASACDLARPSWW